MKMPNRFKSQIYILEGGEYIELRLLKAGKKNEYLNGN